MVIKSVEFAGAVARPGGAVPGELPQVAFSGRSNVGKSSLVNRLLGRQHAKPARVSATPGKTQEINFYRIVAEWGGRERTFFLVDLPGYGYARAPHAVREAWRPLVESYLRNNPDLRGVVQLIDARHALSAHDRRMVEYLAEIEVPALFALTKIDKLRTQARREQVRRLTEELGLDTEQVVPFSAVTGEGREELLGGLAGLLEEA